MHTATFKPKKANKVLPAGGHVTSRLLAPEATARSAFKSLLCCIALQGQLHQVLNATGADSARIHPKGAGAVHSSRTASPLLQRGATCFISINWCWMVVIGGCPDRHSFSFHHSPFLLWLLLSKDAKKEPDLSPPSRYKGVLGIESPSVLAPLLCSWGHQVLSPF